MGSAHLTIDQLAPEVDLVGCWEMPAGPSHSYRVPGHHLILIERGSITAVTPDGRFTAGARDLICFRPADRNFYATPVATRCFQVALALAPPPRDRLPLQLVGIGLLPQRLALGRSYARARERFEAMCLAISYPGAAARVRVRAAALELLAIAIDAAAGAAPAAAAIDALERARQTLESSPQADLRIAAIARELGFGVDHFIRRFRARFGVTPKRYRTQVRLRWAAERLGSGTEPVKRVAREVGFSDATAFARVFRRYLGVLPSQVRDGGIAPSAPSTERRGLFPLNQHLMRPDSPADWQRRYEAR